MVGLLFDTVIKKAVIHRPSLRLLYQYSPSLNFTIQQATMDSQPTAKALHSKSPLLSLSTTNPAARINADISQLLQRYENIMATATVRPALPVYLNL